MVVGPPLVGVPRSVGKIKNLLNTKKAKNLQEDRLDGGFTHEHELGLFRGLCALSVRKDRC